jgi:hypothetical protein
MDKLKLKYFIDIGMLIAFLCVGITGIMKLPGFMRSLGRGYIGNISDLHDNSGIALVIFVVLHLILNFNWLVSVTKTGFKRKKCEE